jgi:hypothetical protein
MCALALGSSGIARCHAHRVYFHVLAFFFATRFGRKTSAAVARASSQIAKYLARAGGARSLAGGAVWSTDELRPPVM